MPVEYHTCGKDGLLRVTGIKGAQCNKCASEFAQRMRGHLVENPLLPNPTLTATDSR
jgi:hypothetical protein